MAHLQSYCFQANFKIATFMPTVNNKIIKYEATGLVDLVSQYPRFIQKRTFKDSPFY